MDSDGRPSRHPRLKPAASPEAAAPPSGVRAWLGPGSLLQSEMLLAPFLTSHALLRLSETASWLLPYRAQLGGVRIEAWDDRLTPTMLSPQRRLDTVKAFVGPRLPDLMRALRAGRALEILHVQPSAHPDADPCSEVTLPDDAWQDVGALLGAGACPMLTDLGLVRYGLGRAAEEHLMRGLAACPHLQALVLVGLGAGVGGTLASALSRGWAPGLNRLYCAWRCDVRPDGDELEALAAALQACPRPALETLQIVAPRPSR
jgi:hypothetical protein